MVALILEYSLSDLDLHPVDMQCTQLPISLTSSWIFTSRFWFNRSKREYLFASFRGINSDVFVHRPPPSLLQPHEQYHLFPAVQAESQNLSQAPHFPGPLTHASKSVLSPPYKPFWCSCSSLCLLHFIQWFSVNCAVSFNPLQGSICFV